MVWLALNTLTIKNKTQQSIFLTSHGDKPDRWSVQDVHRWHRRCCDTTQHLSLNQSAGYTAAAAAAAVLEMSDTVVVVVEAETDPTSS